MGKTFFVFSVLTSSVAFQCLWHNKNIFSSSLPAKGITFVGKLFQNNQQIKKWDELKTELDLSFSLYKSLILSLFRGKKLYEITLRVLAIFLS